MQKSKTLILGGSSLIAQDLIKHLENKSVSVDFTYNKIEYKSGLRLDINNKQSVETFMEIVSKNQYDYIINFIGKLSKQSIYTDEAEILEDIMKINFTSVISIVERLIKRNLLNNGKVIFLSSISGIEGSYDANYAAAKAALNMYVKSRVRSLDSNLANLIAICPTLIEDSAMYKSMSEVEWVTHKNKRATGKLLTFRDVILKILEVINTESKLINGKIISV
jgi:3-oxoacyl-[acyl-carrier protein] reductase